MRYFSMFSGIGGFELGIQRAYNNQEAQSKRDKESRKHMSDSNGKQRSSRRSESPDCIGFSEIDKYAIKTYETHFKHKNYGDCKSISTADLPNFDILCGGFPCQSFSLAGKRKGFQDTRGTLFHEILRVLAAKKPRLCFLENVKGLLSADDGRCFSTIISALDELGYDVEWQVLNSKNIGVPQNRERVFIIGHLRGTSSRQIFPLRQGNQENNEAYKDCEITRTVTTAHAHGTAKHMSYIQSHSPRCGDPKKGGTGLLESSEHCFTLDSSPHYVNGIRRLTPIECERLQGFPDNWTVGSDTQRYKQCGNAVTVNVIQEIAERILAT